MKNLRFALIVFSLVYGAALFTAANEIKVDYQLQKSAEGETNLRISFQTLAGIRYELLQSDDFAQWTSAEDSLVGNGAQATFEVPALYEAQYFKVSATLDDVIVSTITGITYPIHVHTPNGYEDGTADYPIIYATDGQWITNGFSSAIQSKSKEVILITIEQGPGNRRAIDYALPGATNYFQFLTTELLPAVETIYRIDPNQRTICGTSLGGLLTGLALFMDDVETPFFKNYLSFDGSFWLHRSATDTLEQTRYDASQEMNATLYLTSALVGPNNDLWVSQFQSALDARNYSGLNIIRRSYNVIHNDVAQPSFEDALDDLF